MNSSAGTGSAAPGRTGRALGLLALIVAGESVFLLPFVLARIFRPTFLDVFGISNLQLGTAFSLYGLIAMISYFSGGPLADRFSARRLMTAALLATSLGGLTMSAIPGLGTLTLLYGYWGLTTIFLFWAALIRATREWGGETGQGRAFGVLDGGRGLFAALLSSLSVMLFASLLPAEVDSATMAQRAAALSRVILIFSGLCAGAALLVWTCVPERAGAASAARPGLDLQGLKKVMGMPSVWLQALIVLCAYTAYKSTDDFSLYARDAFGYDDVEAARLGTASFWMRPLAAVAAGLLADRLRAVPVLAVSFAVVIAGSLGIAAGWLRPGLPWLLLFTVAGTSAGIYALRGLYFAIFGQARVPLLYTGSAVGLVSFVGFTPDIFMGPLMGYLLDSAPGAAGHRHLFAVVAGFGMLGLIATLVFGRVTAPVQGAAALPNSRSVPRHPGPARTAGRPPPA